MHSSNLGFPAKFATLSLVLMLVTIWLVLRGYHGLTGDGQIYAFQAFARLHPQLTADLYLKNTSQDQFTLFSPLYAWWIGFLGLEHAARLLTLVFSVWFLAASWSFASAVAGRDTAWLTVAFLLIIAGDFGGSGVFRILDLFLTARLPAEALIITALACHVRERKGLGLLLALGALFIHPLMALPGSLLLVCLWLPARAGVMGAIGGVFAALAMVLVAGNLPAASAVLTVMDAPWLDVVRERSQFLFLQLWSMRDWDINAQPFISLGLTAISVQDQRIRKLCASAALVGAAGLAVALSGGFNDPVALLVQGQAWRWVWITVFIGAALVPVTARWVWRDDNCGPLCALLLVSAWILPGGDRTICAAFAMILWLTRARISSRPAAHCRWVTAALGAGIVVWALVKCWPVTQPSTAASGGAPSGALQGQSMPALRILTVLLAALVFKALETGRTLWMPRLISAVLIVLSIGAFPTAFKQSRTLAAAADTREFADWENAIPPTGTVLVAPMRDVGAFVWFTLGRPNYLAMDQSSGVAFSRVTALEVRRRSEVLLPIMDPDWKIRTSLRAQAGHGRKEGPGIRPLTAEKLTQVCADPQLGFVIAPEQVGFDPLRHERAGAWKDWNLYDCRKVRSARSAT
jgi:hypothetical protein